MGTSFLILGAIVLLPGGKQHSEMKFVIAGVMFIQGLQTAIIVTAGFCYFLELAPAKYKDSMGAFYNVTEGSIYIVLTIYYRFISDYWKYQIIFGAFLGLISFIFVLIFVPESPEWLYSQQKYVECQ